MARRRWYRRYPRVVAAKKKWATNISNGEITVNPDQTVRSATLVENKAQSNAPTPTIIKTGNFKVQGDVYLTTESSGKRGVQVAVFIIYVPEGFSSVVDSTFISNHPEWILGWTYVDTPLSDETEPVSANKYSITSRLKRNLNSGDKIVVAISAVYGLGSSASIHGTYMAQYWTCAN